ARLVGFRAGPRGQGAGMGRIRAPGAMDRRLSRQRHGRQILRRRNATLCRDPETARTSQDGRLISEQETRMTAKIVHIALKVKDLESSTIFYEDVFGFRQVATHRSSKGSEPGHVSRHMTDGKIDLALMVY